MITIHTDCRHFKGDRPCRFHKEQGVHCGDCSYYDPLLRRILIIKLDAIGDVLRTTCILHGLKVKYPGSWIKWVTAAEAVPVLFHNPLVDEVVSYPEAWLHIQSQRYDLVINLDASPKSAMLATLARAEEGLGYGFDARGFVYPLNPEAVPWYQMGLFDDIKRCNAKTYQEIALEICRLPAESNRELILQLTEAEWRFAEAYARRHHLAGKRIVGLNTGAGSRWPNKKWTVEGFTSLARLLRQNLPDCAILLYGGPEEEERNRTLARLLPDLLDTGCRNALREFAALVGLCDVLVTGDTLAMHIAIALKKQVVILFGPTSHVEIETYDRGEKVLPPSGCACFYRNACTRTPTCMETITPEQVYQAVKRCLKALEDGNRALGARGEAAGEAAISLGGSRSAFPHHSD